MVKPKNTIQFHSFEWRVTYKSKEFGFKLLKKKAMNLEVIKLISYKLWHFAKSRTDQFRTMMASLILSLLLLNLAPKFWKKTFENILVVKVKLFSTFGWTMHMLIKLWSNNICNPQGKGLLPEQAFPMDKYKKPFYLNAGRFACKWWKGRPTWLLINQWDWLASHQPLLSGSNSNFHPTLVWGKVLEGIL